MITPASTGWSFGGIHWRKSNPSWAVATLQLSPAALAEVLKAVESNKLMGLHKAYHADIADGRLGGFDVLVEPGGVEAGARHQILEGRGRRGIGPFGPVTVPEALTPERCEERKPLRSAKAGGVFSASRGLRQ